MNIQDYESHLVDSIVIRDVCRTLPNRQRAVLGLSMHGYTQLDIARLLGVSRTSVWSARQRALRAVGKYFKRTN